MDTSKITESVELALEALRDLEEAIHHGDKRTMNLKTEVLRQTLFSILETIKTERDQ